jgi:hypothetical protein
MKILVLLAILIFHPLCSFADVPERKNTTIEIFNAQHLTEQLNSQLEIMKGGAIESLSKSMFNKVITDNPETSTIPKDKANEVMTNFVKRNMSAITSEMLLSGMASVYAENLSIEELNTILAYYKSPIGQKDVAATAKVGTALTESMLKIIQQQLDQSFIDLVIELIDLSKKTSVLTHPSSGTGESALQ